MFDLAPEPVSARPGLAKVLATQRGGLDPFGSLDIVISERTLFVLTAYNGSLRASTTVEVVANNPVPELTVISPESSTDIGSGGLGLTVTGSNFIATSFVHWNGADRPTTYISSTQLSAAVAASDLVTPSTSTVTVHNAGPGGGESGAKTFTLNYPAPSLSSISPTSAVKGTSLVTISLTGSGFSSASTALWNGIDLGTTSFSSATQLTLTVPSSQLATDGTILITVTNPSPGGGTTSEQIFTVGDTNPVPTINTTGGLSPTSALEGSADTTLTVTGTNFVSGSIVRWNGTTLTTETNNIINDILTATIPAANLYYQTQATITVFNPSPGGGPSTPGVFFDVTNPTATFDPSSRTAGGPAFTLTVTATGTTLFTTNAKLIWSGQADIVGSLNGAKSIFTASVPASYINSAGSPLVRVENVCVCTPAPTTDSSILQINDPTITISGSATHLIGTPDTLTVTLSAAQELERILKVESSNTAVATVSPTPTTIGPSTLTTAINVTTILPGTTNITATMTKADGGTVSNVFALTVTYPPPTINSLGTTTATAGGEAFTQTINGADFIDSTVTTATCDGTSMTVTSVTPTVITATVPITCIASAGAKAIVVTNQGQSTTATATLDVGNPTLTITDPILVDKEGTLEVTVSLGVNQAASRTVTLTEVSTGGTGDISFPAITPATTITISSGTSSQTVIVQGDAVGGLTLRASVTAPAALIADGAVTVAKEPTDTGVGTVIVIVTPPAPSATTVFGETANLKASVTTSSGNKPTGNVTFKDGGTAIGTCTSLALTAGVATCSISTLSRATHLITAFYLGAADFAISDNSASPHSHVVSRADTLVTITSDNADPSEYNEQITVAFTVTAVSPGGGTPIGTVTITVSGGAETCNATVASGSCTITLTNVGSRTLTATYAQTTNYNDDTDTEAHTVNKANTTTTAIFSNVVTTSFEVRFPVSVNAPGSGTPSSQVSYTVVKKSDGSTVTSGTVAPYTNVTISGLTASTAYTVEGTYPTDSNFNTSNVSQDQTTAS